jgi:hypothetical protein
MVYDCVAPLKMTSTPIARRAASFMGLEYHKAVLEDQAICISE